MAAEQQLAQLQAENARLRKLDEYTAAVRELYSQIDLDGDGVISRGEFSKAMTGKRKVQLRALFAPFGDWKHAWNELVRSKENWQANHDELGFDEFKAVMGR